MDLSELIRLVRRAPAVLAHMPLRTALTMVHAGAVLVAVELTLRWVPLPRLARLLGVRLDLGPGRSAMPQFALETLPDRSRRRLFCTMRVADAWPLGHGPCLRRALVAGHLLRTHEPSVRVGVAKSDNDTLVAHAWLEIDGQPLEVVSGYAPFERPISQVT